MPHGGPIFEAGDRLTAALLSWGGRLGPPVTVEIDDFSLQLDLTDGLSRGLWLERQFPQSGRALKAQCRPGDVVFDVGANLGYMALIAARQVGPSGRVIAVEPAQRSFQLLRANVAANFPERVIAVRAACDETDGTATVYVCDVSEEYSSMRPEAIRARAHTEVVPARSLRSLARELEVVPNVVKVDVEGAEWAVLKGLIDDTDGPRALVVEAYAHNTRQFGYVPSEMCQWLLDRGYSLAVASEHDDHRYTPALVDGPDLYDVVAMR